MLLTEMSWNNIQEHQQLVMALVKNTEQQQMQKKGKLLYSQCMIVTRH